jgi:hypothetical protein
MLIAKLVRLFNAPVKLDPADFKVLPVRHPEPNPLALLNTLPANMGSRVQR